MDRQIITVTHNANIVLGGDAELVIVANQCGKNAPNKNFALNIVAAQSKIIRLLWMMEKLQLEFLTAREYRNISARFLKVGSKLLH